MLDPETAAALGVRIEELALPGQPFPIWMVRTDAPLGAKPLAWLREDERRRAMRFAYKRLQDRYVAAHLALRLLMARHLGRGPDEACFAVDDGLPFPRTSEGLHWSLSYSGTAAIIGLCENHPVAVDIEQVRAIPDCNALAEAHYTQAERRALAEHAEDAEAYSRSFLAIWVRKEACVKAMGTGLALPLTQVASGSGYEQKKVRIGEARLRTSAAVYRSDFLVGWAMRLPNV